MKLEVKKDSKVSPSIYQYLMELIDFMNPYLSLHQIRWNTGTAQCIPFLFFVVLSLVN
jgi:hypothetical protein